MTGRQDLFEESMRLGHSAAWDQEWDRAIEFYRKALAEFPEDPTALAHLGLALLETGRMEEALSAYQRAAEASSDDPIPAEKCAEIFEQMGQTHHAIEQREAAADLYSRQRNADKAIENWTHSARLDPNNLAVRTRLALTFERLGRKREAAHEYLSVAAILQHNRKIDRALETAQNALRLQPTDPEALSALRALRQGTLLPPPSPPRGRTGPLRIPEVKEILRKETPKALPEGERELDDPGEAAKDQALTMLAAMLFDESSEGGADETSEESRFGEGMSGRLGEIRKSPGSAKKYQLLGKAIDLQTRGNKRQAAKEFARTIESGLDHPAAHYILGLLLKDLHDYDGARQHLMVSIGHPDLTLGANLTLGRITRSQGNMADSARYLLQALQLADSLSVNDDQSGNLNELYEKTMATLDEGNEEEISKIVESILNFLSGPEWLQRIRIARGQLESQATGPAIVPIANLVIGVERTDRIVHALENIDQLLNQGFLYSAMEESLLALGYNPGYLGLHLRIADILLRTGRREQGLTKLKAIAETHRMRGEMIQATKLYKRILQISPVDIEARRHMIDLLTQQDRAEEALSQFIELAEIYRQMADINTARKMLADALQFAQLHAADRNWMVKILRELADIDMARLDWRRALRVYDQICKLDPTDDQAQVQLIDLNFRLGQEDEAAIALDRYLQYLAKDDRGAEILPMLEEMTRDYPGKPVLHSRLAEAYRATGRKADAIAQYDALGEIQLDAGQMREAIRTIQTIIQMGPPDLEGYQELLKNLQSGGIR